MSPLRIAKRSFTSRFVIALGVPALAVVGVLASNGTAAGAPANPSGGATTARLLSASTTSFAAAMMRRPVDRRDRDGDIDTRRDRMSRNREIAWEIMPWFGWKSRYQFRYLNELWNRESSWNIYALNPSSGAYGIPQAVPGSKMGSAGRNWRTSALVQIRWGLRYIRSVYGSPQRAWAHECAYGWY